MSKGKLGLESHPISTEPHSERTDGECVGELKADKFKTENRKLANLGSLRGG